MGHLKASERICVINIFNALPFRQMHYSIEILARSARKQIYEWQHNQTVSYKQRDNLNKRFISEKGLLAINSCWT